MATMSSAMCDGKHSIISHNNARAARLPPKAKMRTLRFVILFNLLAGGAAIKKRTKEPSSDVVSWLREAYPNPESAPGICRSKSMRMCDPDALLKEEEAKKIDEFLLIPRDAKRSCPSSSEQVETTVEVQFAVALARKVSTPRTSLFWNIAFCSLNTACLDSRQIDLTAFGPYDDLQIKGARVFAQYLHDKWGVGMDTACGGTGVLIFLSDRDRAIYISRGSALESVLTDRRLDRTIESMKVFLQKKEYGEAVINALREIEFLIQLGEPDFRERVNDWIMAYTGVAWFAVIVGLAIRHIWKDQQTRRTYARVASHLDELDRSRAEALQGRFLAVSCPICLESFEPRDEGSNPQKGSDGLPLKLLRCGHVYDETCWKEWINSGQGNVSKCPICKQDIGGTSEVVSPRSASTGTVTRRTTGTAGNENEIEMSNESQQGETRVLQQYGHERNFRLARLGTRYPQFIRPQQLQRWTQGAHDGALARDPTFVSSDPQVQATTRGHSSSGSSSSGGFGGGSSAGGRGGRW
jgi:uncharacterized membrane protein YgcG